MRQGSSMALAGGSRSICKLNFALCQRLVETFNTEMIQALVMGECGGDWNRKINFLKLRGSGF